MNLKDIRTARKYDCVIRKIHCTTCGMTKFIVRSDDYNAYDVDVVSKCCHRPDYRL
jgi:hypothetical protein